MRALIERAIEQAKARSVALYLRRQTIGTRQQEVVAQASLCDQELIAVDGEIRALEAVLTALPQESTHGE